jgi:rhomboid protease GluP
MTNFLSFFKPKNGYLLTPIIIYTNLIIFILMIFSGVHFMEPEVDSLILWGGNIRVLAMNGQWW